MIETISVDCSVHHKVCESTFKLSIRFGSCDRSSDCKVVAFVTLHKHSLHDDQVISRREGENGFINRTHERAH